MNFLLDRDAAGWGRDLASLKKQVGDCDTTAAMTATSALAGEFTWRCAHGRVTGTLLLAPTHPPHIQSIKFERKTP
jgi:D-alanyl-D-alanine-carboxypeptidase/D-alanyl-D-alanine-endopeptidase